MPIPYSELVLSGKTYNLRFGLREMCLFEKATGVKIQELEKEMSMNNITEMLCQMLKRHIPDLTVEQTQDMIDETADAMTDVIEIISKAMNAVTDSVGESPNVTAPTAKRSSFLSKRNTK